MTDLTADVNDNQVYWKVSDMPVADYLQAGDEIVRIIYRLAQHEEVYVERGYAGTTAAEHSAGELTTLWVPGAGGDPFAGQTAITIAPEDGSAGNGGSLQLDDGSFSAAGSVRLIGGAGDPDKEGGSATIGGGSGNQASSEGAYAIFGGGSDVSDAGAIDMAGSAIGFTTTAMGFFGNSAVPRPEVPASPTEQDIVDALVALGLVTQAP
jgi:hypothetical protein